MIRAQGFRENVILLLGGPRITHALAVELGFDAGFGPGTKPVTVASFLIERLVGRSAAGAPGTEEGG
jgi:beta-lysine 5,6-aminomutase beta subunit